MLLSLGECLDFISRGVAPKYVTHSSVAVLNQRSIRWDHIDKQYLKYHDPSRKVKPEVFIRKGDVVINSTGDITIGRAYYFQKEWPNLFVDSHVTILRLNRDVLLPEFFIYLLPTKECQDKIYSLVTGATGQLELNRTNLQKLEVIVPPIPIQQKIASILSAYDDLIEVNDRRIKILEKMARLIYKEWFIKFRFPGHEKVKMVESELGPIPEGWDASSLGTILEKIESGSRPKGGAEDLADGIPTIGAENILGLGQFNFSKTKYVAKSFFENMRAGVVSNGDVLIYKDGAQIGRKSFFDEDFPFTTCCVNEHVFILRANKRISQKYLFFWLDQPWVTQEIINLNANAAQPGINKASVNTLPILIPNSEIVQKFDEIVDPLIKLLFTRCKENHTLRQIRDLLLPKLISGEIDVSDLDLTIKESM